MSSSKVEYVSQKDLHFDPENPRLAEFGALAQDSEEKILKLLWDTMDVRELAQSIAASGFFVQEALIVSLEGGRFTVIEGNRRLAAVRVLLSDQLVKKYGWSVPVLGPEARKNLEKLPVLKSSRQDSWRFLGFKHVNGPAKWSSYAKAKYIAEVHRTFGIPLSEIANQIGDNNRTVQRLYRGLMVIEQAENSKVYDREDRFRDRFAFSHLYTGLGYDGISSFLELKFEDEAALPVPPQKLEELGELCVWLYGSKRENKPPVVESQNPDLRRLNAVVGNREAISALRSGAELAKAFEISQPPTKIFEDALLAAKRDLTNARAYLTTGYDLSEALLRIAGTIANLADDIYSEMERKRNPDRKSKRFAES